MRNICFLMMLAAMIGNIRAFGFKTAGNGTTYTLDKLSAMEDANIYKYVDEDDGEIIYQIYENDTIAIGDRFVMEDGVTLQFDDQVTLVIEGDADFRLQQGSTFDSAFDDADYATPIGIYVTGGSSQTEFVNCTFYYVGLRCSSPQGMKLSRCNFYSNNGAIGQAALTLGPDGAPFTVEDCTFEYCQKPAIAGAANYYNPLTIKNCTFSHNALSNRNTPQLNLTAASSIIIDSCTITGDTDLTMVGGIGISNFGAVENTDIVISNCQISDNRYGIGTVGPMNIRIEGNLLLNNHYETNAMNGGSGISLYDPYGKTTAVLAKNHIEGNLWGVTIIGCKDVCLGHPTRSDVLSPGMNVFKDNGNNGQLYDLYNNSKLTVYAQNNTWNVSQQTEEQIETVVFHQHDDASLGQVIFMPAADTEGICPILSTSHDGQHIYDLKGRMTDNTQYQKSIFIVNGKKVVR